MTSYNIKHMARVYNRADLETIMKEAAKTAAHLSNLLEVLERTEGTIGAWLAEQQGEFDKLAKACRFTLDTMDGYEIVKLPSTGKYVSTKFYEIDAKRIARLGYTYIDAISMVASREGLTEEDAVAVFGY